MIDMEKLKKMLFIDMRHWSVEALREANRYVNDKCLNVYDADEFRWWWDLRKEIREQLDAKEARNDHC